MTSLFIGVGSMLVLAIVGTLIVGLTFRAARAVRVARPKSPHEWVMDAMPSGTTVRSLGAEQYEAVGSSGDEHWRITWSNESTVVEARLASTTLQRQTDSVPDRGLRAIVNEMRHLLAQA